MSSAGSPMFFSQRSFSTGWNSREKILNEKLKCSKHVLDIFLFFTHFYRCNNSIQFYDTHWQTIWNFLRCFRKRKSADLCILDTVRQKKWRKKLNETQQNLKPFQHFLTQFLLPRSKTIKNFIIINDCSETNTQQRLILWNKNGLKLKNY